MVKLLQATILALLFTACIRTPEQAARRIHRIIERFPTAIDSTTTTHRDTIRDTVTIDRIIHDTITVNATNRAIDAVVDSLHITDTVIVYNIKRRLHELCTIEGKLGPAKMFETNGVKVRVWAIGDNLHLTATIIKETITVETSKIDFLKKYNVPLTKDHWFLAFCAAVLVWVLTIFAKFR